MRAQRLGGYTLIELLIVISLTSILFLAAPSMATLVDKNRQRSQITELTRLIQVARSNAVNTGHITTLCGSSNGINCENDWSSPTISVFEDRNNDHAINAGDEIIFKDRSLGSKWHWRGSNRPYLRFRADGLPMEKGHFILCPLNRSSQTASKLVLNWMGRSYTTNISTAELPAGESCN